MHLETITLCGEWCGHVKNSGSYKHKTLSADFTNKSLHEELTKTLKFLQKMANKLHLVHPQKIMKISTT